MAVRVILRFDTMSSETNGNFQSTLANTRFSSWREESCLRNKQQSILVAPAEVLKCNSNFCDTDSCATGIKLTSLIHSRESIWSCQMVNTLVYKQHTSILNQEHPDIQIVTSAFWHSSSLSLEMVTEHRAEGETGKAAQFLRTATWLLWLQR